jgi:hypothetical protein
MEEGSSVQAKPTDTVLTSTGVGKGEKKEKN